MTKYDAITLLEHATQYCDEMSGTIMYDPEQEYAKQGLDHIAYSQAAQILESHQFDLMGYGR